MKVVVRICLFILAVPLIPLIPVCWLFCRLMARRCPNCNSKWRTELIGEWDEEHWKCHRCGQYWGWHGKERAE